MPSNKHLWIPYLLTLRAYFDAVAGFERQIAPT